MNPDIVIRLACFFLLLLLFMAFEHYRPERQQALPHRIRWPINFGLTLLNSLIMGIMPVTAAGMALYCGQQGIGLLHQWHIPEIPAIVFGIIWLDFIIYWQHRVFHRLPALWRLHILHHTDGNLDASSALRFHPLEIVVSLVIKVSAILLMGVSPLAVIIFEIILNGMALFNHANLHMPGSMDNHLRKWFVTPDMHRIHHSQLPQEMHSNFGFNLSIWDKLFGSYTPQASQPDFPLGIRHITFISQKDPVFLLALPFASTDTLSGDQHE